MVRFIDLTGEKFGRLEVIERAENSKCGQAAWECLCKCGKYTTVVGKSLRRGLTKSCGCLARDLTSCRKRIQMTGQVFGRLTVIGFGKSSGKTTYWRCVCECGKEVSVSRDHLRGGDTKSCGCLQIDMMRKRCGSNHPRWVSDRECVVLNARTQKAMNTLLCNSLKRTGTLKTTCSEEVLGYKKQDLIIHMELKFFPGMSWSNWGEWHIDHIKPIKVFLDEGTTDPKVINALDNLQPLSVKDNLRKGSKYDCI